MNIPYPGQGSETDWDATRDALGLDNDQGTESEPTTTQEGQEPETE